MFPNQNNFSIKAFFLKNIFSLSLICIRICLFFMFSEYRITPKVKNDDGATVYEDDVFSTYIFFIFLNLTTRITFPNWELAEVIFCYLKSLSTVAILYIIHKDKTALIVLEFLPNLDILSHVFLNRTAMYGQNKNKRD